jgi:hypothetical protein
MAKSDKGVMTGEPITYQVPAPAGAVQMETFIPWTLVKRGVRRQVITPIDAPEQFKQQASVERSARQHMAGSPVSRALGLAHYWARLLDEGKYRSLTEIAALEGLDLGQLSRTAQLARLAPDIVESCLSASGDRAKHEWSKHKGRKRNDSKLEHLSRVSQAATWAEQWTLFHSLHNP